MSRRPDPLLEEFLDPTLTLPEICWDTVPFHVDPYAVWDSFEENVEGWVPAWYPVRDPVTGRSYGEFERAWYFHEHLVRTLRIMHRWPLWGTRTHKKHAVAIALIQMYCDVVPWECGCS